MTKIPTSCEDATKRPFYAEIKALCAETRESKKMDGCGQEIEADMPVIRASNKLEDTFEEIRRTRKVQGFISA